MTLYQEFIDCSKGYHSFMRKVLSNILIEFGVTMKLVMLVRMCLNEAIKSGLTKTCLIQFLFGVV